MNLQEPEIYLPGRKIRLPCMEIYLLGSEIYLGRFEIYLRRSKIYLGRLEMYLPGPKIYLPPSEIDLERPEIYLRRLQKTAVQPVNSEPTGVTSVGGPPGHAYAGRAPGSLRPSPRP